MDATRIAVKLFAADSAPVDRDAAIVVFHKWIQQKALDEMFIDVVDYRHVQDGPGVLLVAHAANYTLDRLGGRDGLTYFFKGRDTSSELTTIEDRLRAALARLFVAALKLEADLGLRFRGEELLVQLNDRLLAPNTAETLEAIAAPLRAVCERLYAGAPVTHNHLADHSRPFAVEIVSAQPIDVATLASRI